MVSNRESRSIDDIVAELTIEEKLALVHGSVPADAAPGYLPPIERLDVPPLRMTDGPVGIRVDGATLFPATMGLAAAFDADLAERYGQAIGGEARHFGFDVLLVPGCNLIRHPYCGRNFEYYTEDPVLNSAVAVHEVAGIQSADVVATPKHYVANNQEKYRVFGSSEVSDRALRELYLPVWKDAVQEADAGAIMSAYNRINGTFAAHHEHLLTEVLKEEFGYGGPVMSDWWGLHDGVAAANAGLDLEMPGVRYLDLAGMSSPLLGKIGRVFRKWPSGLPGPADLVSRAMTNMGQEGGLPPDHEALFPAELPEALESGALSEERFDDMVRRVLTMHERIGVLDGDRTPSSVTPADNRAVAREIAVRGSVLLKNDAALPLESDAAVAVVGPNADEAKRGGMGEEMSEHSAGVSPLDGIRNRAAGQVVFERGHPPVGGGSSTGFDLGSLLPFGQSDPEPEDATGSVADADVAVVVVQDYRSEGVDAVSFSLPGRQDRLVSTVATAAETTVVVLQTAGPVAMPWLSEVDAVLEAWYPGQEGGDAIARVLYGDADPGGRLPVTFGAAEDDYPTNSPERYPGTDGDAGYRESHYDEGVFVGYRHFDAHGIDPLFPFGHGLSYAEFDYADAELDDGTLAVSVENTGDRDGREVVQAYVRPPETDADRPVRELAGFEAVGVPAGGVETVEIGLDERSFSRYDESEGWTVDPGTYTVEVGRSSRDARIELDVER